MVVELVVILTAKCDPRIVMERLFGTYLEYCTVEDLNAQTQLRAFANHVRDRPSVKNNILHYTHNRRHKSYITDKCHTIDVSLYRRRYAHLHSVSAKTPRDRSNPVKWKFARRYR